MSGGAEAVLHSVNKVLSKYHNDGSLTMLTVDYLNAFNLVDRSSLLQEVRWVGYLEIRECCGFDESSSTITLGYEASRVLFPVDIQRPSLCVKLLGGAVSRDKFYYPTNNDECPFREMMKDMEVHFDMTVRHKAVFECLRAPHAQDFLLAIPIYGFGQHMSPVEYRTILKYRLIIPLFPVDAICPVCRKTRLDSFVEHAVHCKEISDFKCHHDGEKYAARLETLKEEARNMIYRENEKAENLLSTLNFVNDLQRLGIWYHFVDDISNVLDNVYNNYYKSPKKWNALDLNLKALGFRLLRHNGYHITQDIFEDIKDETGNFKGHLIEDTLGSLGKISDQYLSSLTSCALDMPLHWRIARVETKWFIEAYEKRSGMNPTVLDLAKLDFNMVQAVHQEDPKYSSRWWMKTTKWDDKLSFTRDRLVENYMWRIGNNYQPQFTLLMRILTKGFALITSVDDVYDVHGTLDELEKFTDVISRLLI
ncbi:camphene synthase [Tanacetum coccineum]